MKWMVFGAVLGVALAGCGDDDGSGTGPGTEPGSFGTSTSVDAGATTSTTSSPADAGSSPVSAAADAGPSASCRVPTGAFTLLSVADGYSGTCSLSAISENLRSSTVELKGTLESFVSPPCTGSAAWVAGRQCVVRFVETCASVTTTREFTFSADGNTLEGTQSYDDGECETQGELSGWRPDSTSAPAPTTSGNRLDVQLYYEDGSPAGEGGYLTYSRWRLRSNGTYASCSYDLAFGPGVYRGGPEKKSQGSYTIVGDTLQLTSSTGASSSVPFKYSAASGEASIDGKSYAQEPPTSDSALCDFGV